MTRKSSSVAEPAAAKAVQRCIVPECGAVYGTRDRIYVCPKCGGPLEIDCNVLAISDAQVLRKSWEERSSSREPRDISGVWRYRELLPFDDSVRVVTLFEGNTPIYEAPRSAKYCGLDTLLLKHQGCNPTGSFKDTGMCAAVTQAVLLGARTVVCASTGNTAASLAAYAARAGLQALILLPRGQISPAKLAQSMDYGALVCEIEGNFDDCMRLIQELGENPSIYVANSINPFRIEGQKTVALEMANQCDWHVPDHVVVPGGNMGNSSALGKGFAELLALGLINKLPKLSVIQAEGASPLARLFASLPAAAARADSPLPDSLAVEHHPRTLASAIKIGAPVSWKKALRAVLRSDGKVISVTEQEIADAKAMIGRDGIGCEPASATTVAGIKKLVARGHIQRGESVIAVLTGHVLKDPDYVSAYHRGTLALDQGGKGGSAEPLPVHGTFRNSPRPVEASKSAILKLLEEQR
jgi:threonine synthase